MIKSDIDELKKREEQRKARVKRQNEAAKNKWETVSCRLPKGTKARVERSGKTLNGLINQLIIAELDRLESRQGLQDPQDQQKPQPVEVPQGVADPTAEEKARQWLAAQEQKRAEDQDSTNTATANRTRSI
jgi:phosphoketolase